MTPILRRFLLRLLSLTSLLFLNLAAHAETKTWDGKHGTTQIQVTMVYFLPSDRAPLPDWHERVSYYARRIEQFHAREFGDQSSLKTIVHSAPLISKQTTAQLRQGDADKIFFSTLSEVDQQLEFARKSTKSFSILLVLSDVNWSPLDDFYRLKPVEGAFAFEGNYNNGEHFPGATSGGSRAIYLADRGVGWGLVSADGWRVPYRGSDCVVYHEGCGHTIGLPHPQTANGSVMSMGQYMGWLSESWLDKEQKSRLGWEPRKKPEDAQSELFTSFRAIPSPTVPRPGQPVRLKLDWPLAANLKSLRVRFQTSIDGPWIDVPQPPQEAPPEYASLGTFDRPIPVSYRIDAELQDGATAELWGYFQVRADDQAFPTPFTLSPDLLQTKSHGGHRLVESTLPKEVNLLELVDTQSNWSVGEWTKKDGKLESPKGYGMRLELPYRPPAEYRMTMIIEPLDTPNGLLLGLCSGKSRFVTLFNYAVGTSALSAIENIDGRNVGNETTFTGPLFKQNRLSQVITTVRKSTVQMEVDGHLIADWSGDPKRLSLGDYWATPDEQSLFLGAYDCRYRFHRITLEEISGNGRIIPHSKD